MLRTASEGTGGVAQFASSMSVAPENASGSAPWNVKYDTFPAAASMPIGNTILPIR